MFLDAWSSNSDQVCVVVTWTAEVDECRGLICHRGQDQWEVVSRPFDKFFNRNEPSCPYADTTAFDENVSQFYISGSNRRSLLLTVIEKADGTCMQLWYCTPQDIQRNFETWSRKVERKECGHTYISPVQFY